jgi:putative CocE/NonD family hydrolase
MQDAYWDSYNPSAAQYANLTLPILTITGIYDAAQRGALSHYQRHLENTSAEGRERHYLVIGPWDHAGTRIPTREVGGLVFGPASLVDLGRLHLQWYAWTMQGGQKPEFLQKNVAYYVTRAERWRYADTLDAITGLTKVLYLDSSGTASQIFHSGVLGDNVGKGPEDMYVYDPSDIQRATLESASVEPLRLRPLFPTEKLTDQESIYADEGKQLIYHSAPFDSDIEISGCFRLSAWIAIDRPDTDFLVSVYEIDLHGHSVLLTTDCKRARYRESLRSERLIRTKDPLRYDFDDFTFVSRLIEKGSRIRLVIGPVNSIYAEKNYNSGGVVAEESLENASSVTVRIFHDELRPTALYIPIGQTE